MCGRALHIVHWTLACACVHDRAYREHRVRAGCAGSISRVSASLYRSEFSHPCVGHPHAWRVRGGHAHVYVS